jgi:hypothetical protein
MGLRSRFWVEATLAVVSGVLLIVTVVWRDWIEILFDAGPDGGDGSLEWIITACLLATTVTFMVLGRQEWRRRVAT